MQTLAKFLNQEEARIALSFLHANGIDAELEGTETFSAMPHVGMGATLLRMVVPEDQLNEARKLMADAAEGANDLGGEDSDYDYGDAEDLTEPENDLVMNSKRIAGIEGWAWGLIALAGLMIFFFAR